jgi:hypothetical protein
LGTLKTFSLVKPGLPAEFFNTLVIGGVNLEVPGPWYTGGLAGIATDLIVKGGATNLGPAAAETATNWIGLLKSGYDLSAFGYAYFYSRR